MDNAANIKQQIRRKRTNNVKLCHTLAAAEQGWGTRGRKSGNPPEGLVNPSSLYSNLEGIWLLATVLCFRGSKQKGGPKRLVNQIGYNPWKRTGIEISSDIKIFGN